MSSSEVLYFDYFIKLSLILYFDYFIKLSLRCAWPPSPPVFKRCLKSKIDIHSCLGRNRIFALSDFRMRRLSPGLLIVPRVLGKGMHFGD